MPAPLRVAFCGLSEFEQGSLASFMRLAGEQFGRSVQTGGLADADFIIADADRPAALAAIEAAQRVADTIFIGRHAPRAAAGWQARPIDPRRLLLELETLVDRRRTAASADAEARTNDAASLPVDALIVDDSALEQRHLQMQLQALGLGSVLAGDSSEALQQLAANSFGHIFIDLQLGGRSALDALGLCRHIRGQHQQADGRVPVLVMMSAQHTGIDRVRATFAGFDHCLAKPLADAPLRQLIKPARRRGR